MRSILHCDINNCFANIEIALNPKLAGLPIAVCGNPKERRGIVLAKSEEAKKFHVKTGDTLWMAKQKCPDIVFVPPHYNAYTQYSRAIQKYYTQFTPQVEPFGLDECWLDVSHHPDPMRLAHQIKKDIRRIFKVTVSIGVSFNKVFAKLGSDLKKPDAITQIPAHTFQYRVWNLPVSCLLGVGRHTTENFRQIGITTIGQLANSDPNFIKTKFGKPGETLWKSANGLDETPVQFYHTQTPRQSISHGTTLPQDAHTSNEIWPTIQSLAENIAFELHAENRQGQILSITVRDTLLGERHYQMHLQNPTATSTQIAQYALMLLSQNYPWNLSIRAFTICISRLTSQASPKQYPLFPPLNLSSPHTIIDKTLMSIQNRYGSAVICRGYQLNRPHAPVNTFPHHA